ncbi:hypothetical protein SAY87_028142 [Trapa incisa]|uniref:Histone-lysine N-methyltransferase SUVR4 n=1 Tax=Trapa incisa TaxID=236973 RepID=A0AAN7KZ94_9MYRT|nr:hypothetical protein SAY87_028142 [Trapa incisa]
MLKSLSAMAPHPKVLQAFKVTRALGIPDEEIKPVLKHLLRVFERNWNFIEEDNYRTLIDSYYELRKNKRTEDGHGSSSGKDDYKGSSVSSQIQGKVISLGNNKSIDLVEPIITSEENLPHTIAKVHSSGPSVSLINSSPGDNSNITLAHSHEIVDCEESSGKNNGSLKRGIVIDSTPSARVGSSTEVIVGLSAHEGPILRSDNGSELKRRRRASNPDPDESRSSTEVAEQKPITLAKKRTTRTIPDIAKRTENVEISLVDEVGNEKLPCFNYIPHSIIYQNARVQVSLARISDDDCCLSCSGNCLSSEFPCACTSETCGEFAYTLEGQLKEEFLEACIEMKNNPQQQHYVYCEDCPIERAKNEFMPEKCKGHLLRKFIKECWRRCGCDMQCGNRVVQRGMTCKLQVFATREGKGWGLRTLQNIPKGTFVCEYIGEIVTNSELHDRNMSNGSKRHTYPVTLDADWGSERGLQDEDALCLDATYNGNVARFINHRCCDANLIDIPIQIETPDRHYYHLAFFTTRAVQAYEELNWDYGIDFDDVDHPIKAFRCRCGSKLCRNKTQRRLDFFSSKLKLQTLCS